MVKPKVNYEARHGAPWRHGERHRRYYVFEPPRWLARWWSFIDPIHATFLYLKLWVATVVTLIVEIGLHIFMTVFVIWLFGWHVLPIVFETLFF